MSPSPLAMRRMSISPIEEDQIVSTVYRRRSSVLLKRTGRPVEQSGEPAASSRILEFYAGRGVLVTGASGFIGKLLIEKLLRTCSKLCRIYVLIRPRRNKAADERLRELFDSPIFDQLRTTAGSTAAFERLLEDKLRLLEGDLTEPQLGLTAEELAQLAAEVSIVLHSAALVSFDGKLRRSIRTNLGGTNNVLELACGLPQLVAFVHVSTCYSNCTRPDVDEHIYPVAAEPTQIINMAECLDEPLVELLRAQLLANHPNPYTWTKQLAEYLVGQYSVGKRLPVLICRPSIVVGTLEEPLAGFSDNRNGMNGLFWAMNRGLLRTAQGCDSSFVDQVPSDVVVNSIIALAWFTHLYYQTAGALATSDLARPASLAGPLAEEMAAYLEQRRVKLAHKLATDESLRQLKHRELIQVPVCHVSSGVENPITFYDMLEFVAEGGKKYPSVNLFCEPRCRFVSSWPLHRLYRFWFHTLTGLLLNLVAVGQVAVPVSMSRQSTGGEPDLATATRRSTRTDWTREFARVDRFVSVLTYFMSNTWHFNPETRQKLMRNFMNGEDNRLFNCDTSNIDWRHFGDRIALGMRRFVLAEPDETLEEARLKFRQTRRRNSVLQILLITAAFHFVYMLILF